VLFYIWVVDFFYISFLYIYKYSRVQIFIIVKKYSQHIFIIILGTIILESWYTTLSDLTWVHMFVFGMEYSVSFLSCTENKD